MSRLQGSWEVVNTNAGYQIRMPHPRSPTGTWYGAIVYEEDTAHLVAATPHMLEALRYYAAIEGQTGDLARAALKRSGTL